MTGTDGIDVDVDVGIGAATPTAALTIETAAGAVTMD